MPGYLDVKHRMTAFAVLAVTVSSTVSPAAAESFFKGKTITYIVSTSPGGGYDTYGRLIAKHMEKQIPGVRIVVRNVPGSPEGGRKEKGTGSSPGTYEKSPPHAINSLKGPSTILSSQQGSQRVSYPEKQS